MAALGKQGYVVQVRRGGGYVKPDWVTLYASEFLTVATTWMERHKKTSLMAFYEYRVWPSRIKYDLDGFAIDLNLNAKTN